MKENKNELETLASMTEKWMKLERKTLKQREAAEQFYEKNLMKLIEQNYIERNKKKVYENVEYLIMSVGTSYEPLALNICLLQPDKIFFICTEGTVKYLVIDIDISKKVILSVGATKEALQPYIQKAAALAQEIRRHLQKMGLETYVEESGFRGFHIWLLFYNQSNCHWDSISKRGLRVGGYRKILR